MDVHSPNQKPSVQEQRQVQDVGWLLQFIFYLLSKAYGMRKRRPALVRIHKGSIFSGTMIPNLFLTIFLMQREKSSVQASHTTFGISRPHLTSPRKSRSQAFLMIQKTTQKFSVIFGSTYGAAFSKPNAFCDLKCLLQVSCQGHCMSMVASVCFCTPILPTFLQYSITSTHWVKFKLQVTVTTEIIVAADQCAPL